MKEEVKESDDDDWVLVILKTVGLGFHYFFIFHHICDVLKSMFSSIDRFFETSHRARIHIGEIFVSRAKFERTLIEARFVYVSENVLVCDEDGCGGEPLDTETENLRRNEPEVQTFDCKQRRRFGDSFNQR